MLEKFDKSKLIHRSDYEKEKAKVKLLKNSIKELEAENEILKNSNELAQQELGKELARHENTKVQYEESKSNIVFNLDFRNKIRIPLLTSIAKANDIKLKGTISPNLIRDINILQGDWEMKMYDHLNNISSESRIINIETNAVTFHNGDEYGVIERFSFDNNNSMMRFAIYRDDKHFTENFILIKMNDEEFEGIVDDRHVIMTKRRT